MNKTLLLILGIIPLFINAQSTEISLNLGHTQAISGLRFSKDSRYLLSSSADETLKLWDVESGKLLKTSKQLAGTYVGPLFLFPEQDLVSFTPDSGPWYNWIWNMKTGNLEDGNHLSPKPMDNLFSLLEEETAAKPREPDHEEVLKNVTTIYGLTNGFGYQHTGFYTNEAYFYTRSGDTLTFQGIWDGQIHQTIIYPGLTEKIAFCSDGRFIFGSPLGATGQSFTIWEQATGKIYAEIALPPNTFLNDISPDGQYLLVTNNQGLSGKYDISQKTLYPISETMSPTNLPATDYQPERIAFNQAIISPNGRYIARGSKNGEIYIHNFNTGKIKKTLTGHTQPVLKLAFDQNIQLLECQLQDGSWRYWNLSDRMVKYKSEKEKASTNEETSNLMAWSDDRQLAIKQHPDGLLELWNMESKQKIKDLGHVNSISAEGNEVRQAIFAPDKKHLLFLSELIARRAHTTDILWNIEQNKAVEAFTFPVYEGSTTATFSPDSKLLVIGDAKGHLLVYDVEKKSRREIEHVHQEAVAQIVFSNLDYSKVVSRSNTPDGAIKLLDLQENKKLATLYFLNETDWVVIGENGLFDASPGGMNSLFYKLEYEGEPEIIELEQLKTRYHEPGLLQQLLGISGNAPRTIDNLGSVALYPKIVNTQIKNDLLNIQLKERNGGMGILSLFVNKKEVLVNINPSRQTEVSIDLKTFAKYYYPGQENTLALIAYNQEGWLKSQAVELEYTPTFSFSRGSGSNSPPSETESADPHLYALIVGTSDYSGDKLDLTYADKDAAAIYQALQAAGKALFNERTHIQLLSTDATAAGGVSNKANIKKALQDIAQQAKPTDVMAVYFSGHGVTYGQAEKVQFYYLTKDIGSDDLSDPEVRNNYAISTEELTSWLTAIPAQKQVMMLDACNSGKVVESLVTKKELNSSQIRALDRMKDRTGMFVISGSAADKVSYEASQYGQGLLTFSLLQGMKEVSAKNDGDVDVMKLFQYSRDKVPELAKGIGGIQTPMLAFPSDGSSFDIGIVKDGVDIPIADIKPVFIRNNFQDETTFIDVLGLGQKVGDYFKEVIKQRGAEAPYTYWDVNQYENAYSINGRYKIDGNAISIKGVLVKGTTQVGPFEVSGTKSELDQLVREMIREVRKMIR
ncbi:MAG: caspase family protein [Saprospiraceae bacterium]